MSKIVCCSGYFNPLHFGHIEYFEKAKALGDFLVVIVNNDEQAFLKKGSTFMKEDERLKIIRSLKIVDFACLSIDTDRSVCRTLQGIRCHIFANGGDAKNDSIPEAPICERLNIQLVDNLGEKLQSSSWLLEKAKQN